MADVQVGLGAVLGDEHLAVLERVHRAGVDVEVRVQLLHGHPQAAGGEQLAEAGGGQALAQRGGDAPGDEQMTRGARLHGVSAVQPSPSVHVPHAGRVPRGRPPQDRHGSARGSLVAGATPPLRHGGAAPVGRAGGRAVAARAAVDLLAQRQHGADLARAGLHVVDGGQRRR